MGASVHELEKLTARQLGQLIDSGISAAVVPFGSVEYHGGHLPLGADAILADAVGAEVARRLGAVLAPTVRVGCSGRHSHLPGTVTLDPETLARLAAEYARALARHGFTLIVLLSAHGGNQPALDAAVAEFGALLPGGGRLRPAGRRRPQSRGLFRGLADLGDAGPAARPCRPRPGQPRPCRRAGIGQRRAGTGPYRALHHQRGRQRAPAQQPLIPALPLPRRHPQAQITTADNN